MEDLACGSLVAFGLVTVFGLGLWKLKPTLTPLVATLFGAASLLLWFQNAHTYGALERPDAAGVVLGSLAGLTYLEWRQKSRPALQPLRRSSVAVVASVLCVAVIAAIISERISNARNERLTAQVRADLHLKPILNGDDLQGLPDAPLAVTATTKSPADGG